MSSKRVGLFCLLFFLCSLSVSAQLIGETLWTSTLSDRPISDSGVLYDHNGIRLTFKIILARDHLGRSTDFCTINPTPGIDITDDQKWAEGRELKLYRLLFRLDNQNSDKKVIFRQVAAVAITVRNEGEPIAHTCSNSTGTDIHAMAVVQEMGASSSIEFNQDAYQDWFFSKPKVTQWRLGQYELRPDNSSTSTGIHNNYNKGLDDFINTLEEELTSEVDKSGNERVSNNLQSKIDEKSRLVLDASSSFKASSSETAKYDDNLCKDLLQRASLMMEELDEFLTIVTKGDPLEIEHAMPEKIVAEEFGRDYLEAVKQKQLSQECIDNIQDVTERYSKRYLQTVNQYLNKID